MLSTQVLFLAANVQQPSIAKEKKSEWWAVTGYLWGYIDPETIPPKPDFNALQGSSSQFMFQPADPAELAKTPTIQHRRRLCMCPPLPPSALRERSKWLPIQVRGLLGATA